MYNPYLGKSYSANEVLVSLKEFENDIQFTLSEDRNLDAASSIADGKIVGWYQGGAECGPRALGNRSILADPRKSDMKDIINARVKFREAFRPFAPSVLFEFQQEYFDLDVPSPYMLIVADIWPCKRLVIPAVTHVDGTGRIQTVMKELNKEYYDLIYKFYEITGVPVVLNTSFNVNKEPIVETPDDAVRCFLSSDFDELYIDNYKIVKKAI